MRRIDAIYLGMCCTSLKQNEGQLPSSKLEHRIPRYNLARHIAGHIAFGKYRRGCVAIQHNAYLNHQIPDTIVITFSDV